MTPGRPWILLRGLSREARHWGDFPRRLGEAFPGAPVTCLDLPGNGKLNAQASPGSVEAMADFCHAELARQDISVPCRLLAMSLGAMVAIAWAQRHPQDLAAAVLINTSLRPFSPFFERLRPANYPCLLRLFALPVSEREMEAAILRMTARLASDPDAVIAKWLQWRRENPVSRQNALRQLMAAARYRAPLAAPLNRLLLLASERDGLVDVACSQRLERQWEVPLSLHPTAGHDLPLDDPAWVIKRLRCWLADDQNAT